MRDNANFEMKDGGSKFACPKDAEEGDGNLEYFGAEDGAGGVVLCARAGWMGA